MAWVYLINQTNRLLVFNLAPFSDGSLHINARSRMAVLQEECAAYEIQAALNATPPRLAKMPAPPQPGDNPVLADDLSMPVPVPVPLPPADDHGALQAQDQDSQDDTSTQAIKASSRRTRSGMARTP